MIRLIKKYPKQADAMILIVGFILGANLFIFFKQAGIDEETRLQLFDRYGFHYFVPTIGGLLMGTSIFLAESYLFQKGSRLERKWIIPLKFLVASVIIIICSVVLQILTNTRLNDLAFIDSLEKSINFMQSDVFLSIYVYMLLLGITLNFFRQLGNKFGHGIIVDYLTGKYQEPVEENRIFMFLDLNQSTRIAEKLGHVKYSRLLNKCFSDLSEVLPKYDGEVYQYVGDEAVITWNVESTPDLLNPILLYRAYEQNLLKSKELYLEKFDEFPSFKASVNCGKVSVSMVGGSRQERAFHGDVLNTASRVLEQCGLLQQKLLITDSFSKRIKGNHRITTIYLKDLFLRGKQDVTKIYQPILHS